MSRTVQTAVIYCFETREEKAYMSIVVFKHRQRLGIAWAQDNCYGGKFSSEFVYCQYNEHYEQVEKTLHENY